MVRDKLILLNVDFVDPAFPDKIFYCWHCVLIEGLLSCYPDLAEQIDIERISWPKPRQEIIDLIGHENQIVPVLILADDAPEGLETGRFGDRRFVNDKDAILYALSVRYGIADPHP